MEVSCPVFKSHPEAAAHGCLIIVQRLSYLRICHPLRPVVGPHAAPGARVRLHVGLQLHEPHAHRRLLHVQDRVHAVTLEVTVEVRSSPLPLHFLPTPQQTLLAPEQQLLPQVPIHDLVLHILLSQVDGLCGSSCQVPQRIGHAPRHQRFVAPVHLRVRFLQQHRPDLLRIATPSVQRDVHLVARDPVVDDNIVPLPVLVVADGVDTVRPPVLGGGDQNFQQIASSHEAPKGPNKPAVP
mmetsp:Transcript_22142/g.72891  ORF Transcript_22142/g.72891 Transcript_22142/m.72891 type:complete len:239 (-) Transcript_22142:750-1466(-)